MGWVSRIKKENWEVMLKEGKGPVWTQDLDRIASSIRVYRKIVNTRLSQGVKSRYLSLE